jgi:hypothetical protein
MASPLLGYNNNVRHLGKVYHIQTEDSGASHGHIFTHLFADGGRIIASKKTTYGHYVGTRLYPDIVKRLMKESHKAMFIALRDGYFDVDEAAGARAIAAMEVTVDEAELEAAAAAEEAPPPAFDVEAYEKAATARMARSLVARATASLTREGRYQSTRAAVPSAARPLPAATPGPGPAVSIFGGDLLSEKSLDEVILSYLADDLEEEP